MMFVEMYCNSLCKLVSPGTTQEDSLHSDLDLVEVPKTIFRSPLNES